MSPPSPEKLRRRTALVSILSLAASGGVLAVVAIAPFTGLAAMDDPNVGGLWLRLPPTVAFVLQDLLAGAVTTFLLAAALILAIGTGQATTVGRRTVLLCLLFGWINGMAVLSALFAFGGRDHPAGGLAVILGVILGGSFGAPVSVALGLLYGLVARWPASRIRALLDRPSLDGQAEALRVVGLTVTAASAFAAWVAGALLFLDIGNDGERYHLASPLVPLVMVAVGLWMFLTGRRQRAALRDMLEAKRNAGEPAWVRVPVAELERAPGALVRTHAAVPDPPEFVLCRVERVGDAAYRAIEVRTPWAFDD